MPLVKVPSSPFYWYDFRFAGRRYRGSTRTTNKKAAGFFESELVRKLASGDARSMFGKRAPVLRDFLPQFLTSFNLNQERSEKTKTYYRDGARLLLASSLSEFPIDRITTSVVASVSFPHSGSTANNAIRTLRRALSHAVELGLLAAVPKMGLRPETSREAIFTPEQERLMLRHLRPTAADVFMVCMDTGMRPEEICRMRWEDVLWAEGVISVQRGKTSAARRTIGISERLGELLRRRIKAQSQDAALKDTPWVFASARSASGHTANVNKAFAEARAAAGLPKDLVLYSARHTFGTEFMAATKDLKLTMSTMGHTDVKTAMRYQHPDTTQVGSVMDDRNKKRSMSILENGHTFGHTVPRVQ